MKRKRNSLVDGCPESLAADGQPSTHSCVSICTAAQTHSNSVPRINPLAPVPRRAFVLHSITVPAEMQGGRDDATH